MTTQQKADAERRRPLMIGIGGIPMQCQFGGVWDLPVVMLNQQYTDAIARAGGIAAVIAPSDHVASHPEEVLRHLDAFIFAGGSDIDPALYGEEPAPELGTVDRPRDDAELALAHAALRLGMPVLGICRGMELINVALGGSLIQHLPHVTGTDRHLHDPGTFENHPVAVPAGSTTATLVGDTSGAVKSHHHQAVGRLGDGLVVTGRDPEDGTVEAIELPGALVVGVQWHPEVDPASGVIERFMAEVVRTTKDRSAP